MVSLLCYGPRCLGLIPALSPNFFRETVVLRFVHYQRFQEKIDEGTTNNLIYAAVIGVIRIVRGQNITFG